MTYIRIECPNCNYSYRESKYGYVEDPIGIPLTRCPRCNQIFKDKKHKEWLQMSPIKKYLSITPRGNWLFLLFALCLSVSFLGDILRFDFKLIGEFLLMPVMIVLSLVADYILKTIRINSQKCIQRIVSSISRTNNETYSDILSKLGKTYDYSIPRILILTQDNKAIIENAIKYGKTENIAIPIFDKSIHNY